MRSGRFPIGFVSMLLLLVAFHLPLESQGSGVHGLPVKQQPPPLMAKIVNRMIPNTDDFQTPEEKQEKWKKMREQFAAERANRNEEEEEQRRRRDVEPEPNCCDKMKAWWKKWGIWVEIALILYDRVPWTRVYYWGKEKIFGPPPTTIRPPLECICITEAPPEVRAASTSSSAVAASSPTSAQAPPDNNILMWIGITVAVLALVLFCGYLVHLLMVQRKLNQQLKQAELKKQKKEDGGKGDEDATTTTTKKRKDSSGSTASSIKTRPKSPETSKKKSERSTQREPSKTAHSRTSSPRGSSSISPKSSRQSSKSPKSDKDKTMKRSSK